MRFSVKTMLMAVLVTGRCQTYTLDMSIITKLDHIKSKNYSCKRSLLHPKNSCQLKFPVRTTEA